MFRCTPIRSTPLLVLLLLLAPMAGCGDRVPQLSIDIVRTFPHDPGAYTQGLLIHEGRVFESTGKYGDSDLRELDPETGEVLRIVPLSEEYFGEGLARVGNRLIQITWQEGEAIVWDLETFEEVERFTYETDGWGLCHDGEALYMTTGGSFLYRRDPTTFEQLEMIQITEGGNPLRQVNELECVGDHIWGNVYMSDRIVRIDKLTGEVVAAIDASGLEPEGGRPADAEAVLNGIAYNPETGTFYLTGKYWRSMFEVRFVER